MMGTLRAPRDQADPRQIRRWFGAAEALGLSILILAKNLVISVNRMHVLLPLSCYF